MSERINRPGSDWIRAMSRPPSERDWPGTDGPGEAQAEVQARWATDTLISIRDIRELFGLGRTAAYELTHRPGFPEPIKLSPRCYRWWASEVIAFAADVRLRTAPSRRSRKVGRAAHRPTLAERPGADAHHRDDTRRPQPEGIVTQHSAVGASPAPASLTAPAAGRVPGGIHNVGASQLAVTRLCTCAPRTVVWWSSWSAGSRCTRRGGRGTGGGRCGTRTGAGASARR